MLNLDLERENPLLSYLAKFFFITVFLISMIASLRVTIFDSAKLLNMKEF